MRKGSKLIRLAFGRSDAVLLYRALTALEQRNKSEAQADASLRVPVALEGADIEAFKERIVKAIAQLGGLDSMAERGDAIQLEVKSDAVAAKHSKRMRSRNGAK